MAVLIVSRQPKARGGRGRAYDALVRTYAPQLQEMQKAGHINSRALAAALNGHGIPSPNGGLWNDAGAYRMLKRAAELGFELVRRGRSRAASKRKVRRRPKEVIEAERRQRMRHFLAKFAERREDRDADV